VRHAPLSTSVARCARDPFVVEEEKWPFQLGWRRAFRIVRNRPYSVKNPGLTLPGPSFLPNVCPVEILGAGRWRLEAMADDLVEERPPGPPRPFEDGGGPGERLG